MGWTLSLNISLKLSKHNRISSSQEIQLIPQVKQPNDWPCEDAEVRSTGWNIVFKIPPAVLEMVVKIDDKNSTSLRLWKLWIRASRWRWKEQGYPLNFQNLCRFGKQPYQETSWLWQCNFRKSGRTILLPQIVSIFVYEKPFLLSIINTRLCL